MSYPHGFRPVDPDAEAARLAEARTPFRRNQWCDSPDHHEWLHMLLDRARADLNGAYLLISRQADAMKAAGVRLPGDVSEPGDG